MVLPDVKLFWAFSSDSCTVKYLNLFLWRLNLHTLQLNQDSCNPNREDGMPMCLARWYRCVWHASQHQYCGRNFLIPFSKQCWSSTFLRNFISWAKELPCKPRTGGKYPIWHGYYRMRTKDCVCVAHTSCKAFVSQFSISPRVRVKDVAGSFWETQHPPPSQLQLTGAKFFSHSTCFALTWHWWVSRY